jgi:hypothetical protein
MNRTPAYWPTRILLAVGVIATMFVVGLTLIVAEQPSFPRPDILGLPAGLVVTLAAAGLSVVGLVWMVRVFRGPRDEPPQWRYRDR